ncbi:MAG: nickel pincer cofactor biosynthesis protein LarC [Treponema succinifaciens]|uniref:nickel pincer cofactor biosynthesis protein LarC n=1 Tax=Treponema succinifaciens TaxID=167 RepID=UPI002A76585E|nr:nickel pincer cofactor biosynthesis protein LarC [Treponema succinifaciens]MDY2616184.1 nickel pincer cofactor biosynthesis protein LarC [Treponema succinifaciens]
MSDLYLECNYGISGDMAVAALLDAGADRTALEKALASIPVKGFKTEIKRVEKNGVSCLDFNVILDSEHENHDHDMNYLFGHESAEHNHGHGEHFHGHTHHHSEAEEHSHAAQHEIHHGEQVHGEQIHHHEHRNLHDVLEIIDKTEMTENARKLAHKIFEIIAQAESKAHSKPVEEVHFHEVGAVDSVVDVIALAVCFYSLHVEKVFVPFLCEGTGTVRCQHGILPVPVPAVANIMQEYHVPLKITGERGEFVTPTGAAFVAAVATEFSLPKNFVLKKIGMGAGKRDYGVPNIVRAMLVETEEKNNPENQFTSAFHDKIIKLETNIDDSTGEALGFVMDELFASGALDVHYLPCFMKKNRPAWLLVVLCRLEDAAKMEKIIFMHTTTIGIRMSQMERTCLARSECSVEVFGEKAEVKVVDVYGEKRFYPEYERVSRIAQKTKKPFGEVYNKIVNECACTK